MSLACLLILLVSSGCVMQRTVKDGDVVVEKKYVIKGPLPGTATGF
jgi:hypothetical protein